MTTQEFKKSTVSNLPEILEIIESGKLDCLNYHWLKSDVPKKCISEPCVLGVDEAGRGPVLGPMVYSVFYCPANEVEILKEIGCTDSKALTEKKRENIFELINSHNDKVGWIVDAISPNLISNRMLKRAKFSLNEIAQQSTISLINHILDEKVNVKEIYVDTIGPADKYQPKSNLFQTALEIGPTKKLSTGCPILDRFLSGGILTEGITEICGESGAGKTQLCMQLALTAQYPTDMGGLNGGVIYICTEEQFHSRRLQQIIENFPFELNGKIKPKINFMDNLFITRNKNIKLIILDSVTALFRGTSTDIEGFQKAKDLRTIVRFFYKLCGTYKVATVCVNQEKLSKLFPDCKITVEKKADSLYPVVGAASICAKVIRDNIVQHWKYGELLNITETDVGTGYPGDPKSKKFLLDVKDDIFGFPNLVRFSWSTAAKLLEKNTAVEWYGIGHNWFFRIFRFLSFTKKFIYREDESENFHNSEKPNISSYFKPLMAVAKHKTVSTYLKERSLSNVDSF
ncbi:hypothetical protein RUM43_007898 [Polyplax serrata]|uniref:Ribonuclease n=1 Tax=Polyplax serrata TaxID=468196 RepID=A0AAN8P6B9_POLSC